MTILDPFHVNRKGPLRVGELVRIKKLCKDGIVLEKPYDVTTIEDIDNGMRRSTVKLYYIGKDPEGKKDE